MKLLGINGIEESSVYQLILARGKAEGKAEGIAEGEAKGRAEEARRIVLLLGEKRFGPPGAEVVAAIERLTDPGQVEALIKRLDEVPGWDELLNGPRSA